MPSLVEPTAHFLCAIAKPIAVQHTRVVTEG